MPSGPVEHDEGMGAGFHSSGDLFEMGVERVCVGPGYDKPGGPAFHRANGTEDIGRSRSLVLGRRRARIAFRPSPGDFVLLSDMRLVLLPDSDLDAVTEPGANLLSDVRGSFERRQRGFVLGIVARACRKLGVAHATQLLSDRRPCQRHAEPIPKPCRQVAAPPTNHAAHRRVQTALHDCRQRRALLLAQLVRWTRRLAVQQALRTFLSLKRRTQSGMICSPTPAKRAASERG